MSFFKNVLSTIIGVLVAMGIIFVAFYILFIALVSFAGSQAEEKVLVKNNSVLQLNLNRPMVDYAPATDPLLEALDFDENLMSLEKVLNAISHAATDNKIKGVSIYNSFSLSGMAQTKAIRNALVEFKKSGKFIYAYSDFYTQKDYYLNSVADSVFLNPLGSLDFKGLQSEVLFFKDFQEKSGIKMEVIKRGKYKSAVEPFLENEMSEANREQITSLLKSLWDEMLTDISGTRKLSLDNLNIIADTLGGRNPEFALKSGLIDAIVYKDQYENSLARESGISDDEPALINITDYSTTIRNTGSGSARIAVIYAQGNIIYGKGDEFTIGQGLMTESLKSAREDDKVKAIVLRVNSPGGSALASELIWREIELTKKEKPFIVSMGDYAASGGYYIACNADKIIAEPTTITGSIGVFGTLPNFKGLADKIGINAEQVGTNKQSVDYSLFEEISPEFRLFVEDGIEETYTTFLARVSEGRNMSVASVDSIAQGRVWSGIEAERIGLVDELGGIDLAIKRAAEAAGIDRYKIDNYPEIEKSIEELIKDMYGLPFAASKEQIIKQEIGTEAYQLIKDIKSFSEQKGVQARLPFELRIK